MKKLFSLMLLLATMLSNAQDLEHKSIEIVDTTLNASKAWDGVMRWIVANEDAYGLRIAYENPNTGSLIVKGEFKDKMNGMQSVSKDLIRPIASFTIEITCSNGKVVAEMTEANYEYKVGYGSIYSLSDFYLKWCKQEMEEVSDILRFKGEKVNCYDSFFEETANQYKAKKEEAETIENDETVSKKERKNAKKYLEKNEWRYTPYQYVNWMPTFTSYELFKGDKGLDKYCK